MEAQVRHIKKNMKNFMYTEIFACLKNYISLLHLTVSVVSLSRRRMIWLHPQSSDWPYWVPRGQVDKQYGQQG
jgi:hypothetical protein